MKVFSTFALLALSSAVIAADDQKSEWSGKAEVGFVAATGNTESTSTNGKINLVYDPEHWRQEFKLETYVAESEVVVDATNDITETRKTADRTYFLSKTDYKYSERSYAYALVDYGDENFTDKDYIGNFSLGYGRTVIKDDVQNLHFEIGYGLRRFQFKDEIEAEEDEVARLAGKYSTKVSTNANFSQEVTAELGKDFDIYKSISQLNVNINSAMALSLGYEVTHTSEVFTVGAEETDTVTTVNLVYNFL